MFTSITIPDLTYVHTVAKSTGSNVIHSDNAEYENVGSTIQMSTLNHLTCSENIAYANLKQSNKDGLETSGPATNTAVYDEIVPMN